MSSMPQIRLRTLLKEDPVYKAWFQKPPGPIGVIHTTPPWRLFVQLEQDGRWSRVDLLSYAKAFSQVKLRLPDAWDLAIHCKPQGFKPPVLRYRKAKVWAPMPEGHLWCDYCRRPTVFDHFSRHHNLGRVLFEQLRCGICGTRQTSLPKRTGSPLEWPVQLSGK